LSIRKEKKGAKSVKLKDPKLILDTKNVLDVKIALGVWLPDVKNANFA
jgi:hypothetical protein